MSDTCRDSFEKWAVSEGMSIKRGTKNYTHAGTYMAWKGWNARTVAEVPSLEYLCNLVLDSLEQPWTMPEMVRFPHERIAGRLHAILIQRQGGRG